MKILYREYGDNVKIVGLADHSASVEDPNGLDRTELLRLVHESLPLSEYSAAGTQSTHTCECTAAPQSLRALLRSTAHFRSAVPYQEHVCLFSESCTLCLTAVSKSASCKKHLVDNDEGVRMRNTMHNRVEADCFVPVPPPIPPCRAHRAARDSATQCTAYNMRCIRLCHVELIETRFDVRLSAALTARSRVRLCRAAPHMALWPQPYTAPVNECRSVHPTGAMPCLTSSGRLWSH